MNFHGVKVAILVNGKLLMHLRDNKPDLFNANMWDFSGGGREGNETPQECAIRETQEEFGITILPDSFIWERIYPAQKDPTQKAIFMVVKLLEQDIKNIELTEGQEWTLIEQSVFFEKEDVIKALKERFQDYIDQK